MPEERALSKLATSQPLFPATSGPTYEGHNLLFVVGCPRSGTTWVQRLLSSHAKIRTGQESNLFEDYIGVQLRNWRRAMKPEFRGGVGLACYFTQQEFFRILKAYLRALLEPMVADLAPNELFLEKSPSHALFLPEILELLPRARVIHVLRDARDAVSSLLAAGRDWHPSAAVTATKAALIWTRHVQAVRNVVSVIPSNQFHEIRYESLFESPVAVLRGCADFLNLRWDTTEIANALEENRASKARASGGGTPIPLSGEVAQRSGPRVVEPKGFIRKAHPGAWETDLSLNEKFRVWRVAHELMNELGYSWPKPMELTFSCLSHFREMTRW